MQKIFSLSFRVTEKLLYEDYIFKNVLQTEKIVRKGTQLKGKGEKRGLHQMQNRF